MKPGAIALALIAFCPSGALSPAAAIPITFGFTGSVTDVPVDDVGTGVGFGSAIEGSYTFESSAADLIAGGSTDLSRNFSSSPDYR